MSSPLAAPPTAHLRPSGARADDSSFARIPLAVPDLRGREAEYLQNCVDDNWVSSAGPHVTAFESAVAKAVGVAHGVALVNGTCALEMALRLAARRRPGARRVAMPAWTFAATANATVHAGLEPLFLDIDPGTWTLDPVALESVLIDQADAIAAVVPVHALGQAADMDPILALADHHAIPVVEDAAGALGALYRGRPVGGLGFAGMLSFNGNKTVTAGGGGMLLTDDEDVARTARFLSAQARPSSAYRHSEVAFNYRMTNLNAAVGLAQMERLDEMVERKRTIGRRYRQALADLPGLSPQPETNWGHHSYWMSCIRCDSRTGADALIARLDAARIDARPFWESLADQDPYRMFTSPPVPVADSLSGQVVALPCSSSLSDAQQERVIDSIRSALV